VTGPDGGEVPQVHGCDGEDLEPFADGDHRCIHAAKPEVGVLAHEARRTPEVGIDELYQMEGVVRPHGRTVQEGGLGRWPQRPVNQITGLGKDRRGNHENVPGIGFAIQRPCR
jgi:hypothetical protein